MREEERGAESLMMGWGDETRKLGSERVREREMGRGVSEERSGRWANRALNSLLFEKDPYTSGKTAGIFSGLLLVGGGIKPRNSSSCVLTAQEACMLSEMISASHVGTATSSAISKSLYLERLGRFD